MQQIGGGGTTLDGDGCLDGRFRSSNFSNRTWSGGLLYAEQKRLARPPTLTKAASGTCLER